MLHNGKFKGRSEKIRNIKKSKNLLIFAYNPWKILKIIFNNKKLHKFMFF